jgi:hypothetical protein
LVETKSGFAIGDILGRSLTIFRRNFGAFILLSGLTMLPYLVALLANTQDTNAVLGPTMVGGRMTPSGRLWTFLLPVLQTFTQVAIVSGTFVELSGQPPRIVEMTRNAAKRFWPALGVVILQGFGVVIGLVFLVVPGLMALTMLYVALPVCVIEQCGATASLNRSAALTIGHRWSVFGLLLVATLGSAVIMLLVEQVALMTAGLTGQAIAEYGMQVAYIPFTAIVGAVLYRDLRVAKEGLGIETVAEVFA